MTGTETRSTRNTQPEAAVKVPTAAQTKLIETHSEAFLMFAVADDERQARTADLANATVALVDAGVIPGFTGKGKPSNALWTFDEYAAIMSETLGRPVSPTNLKQWRGLGLAIRAGVKPGSEVWADLYNYGAKVNSSAVTSVLRGEQGKPSAAKIAKAIAPNSTPRTGNGNTSGTRKSPAVKAKADLPGILNNLQACIVNLSPAEFAKVPDKVAVVYKAATKQRADRTRKTA